MTMRHRVRWALVAVLLGAACLDEGLTDVSAPFVVIVSPAANATVSGTITVQVQAADDTGIESITLLVDGVVLGQQYSEPYNFIWATTQVPDGAHTLRAVAVDRVGNQTAVERTVSVDNRPS